MKAFEIKYDQDHYKRLEEVYVRKIEQLYLGATREAVKIAESLGTSYDPESVFEFDKFPQTKTRVDRLFKSVERNILTTVKNATENEWYAAAEKNDELVNRILKSTSFKKEQLEHLYNRNLQSLAAFQRRKQGGLNLSDRVWKYTNQFKGEIELGLDVGLSEGKSASAMSRDLREYLQNPDKLFRRVRDKRGELVLSKNARKYHPGPGVYRSSYKNALRLTRTEVNMAYRESDFERWQQLDFVVGIEVRRSNHIFDCVLCETLVGRYPKDFLFRGWHPQCRCYCISILSTIDEFIAREKARMEGKELGRMKSVNEVSDIPANYANWITGNQVKIEQARHKPYFIKDNLKYSGDLLLSSEIKALRARAFEVGDDIDAIAKEFAERFGGYVSPINYKSADSIKRKALDELNGRIDEIKDSVRNTIILPKNRIEEAIEALQKDERFLRVKRQFADKDPLGYNGNIANLKAKNGIVAEIQINTERMIYAKEKPENAIRILGQKKWDEIHKATGLQGGLGHEFYEEWRLLAPETARAIEIQKMSKAYYVNFINEDLVEELVEEMFPDNLEAATKFLSRPAVFHKMTEMRYKTVDEFYETVFGGRQKAREFAEKLVDDSSVYMAIDSNTLKNKILLGDGKFKNSLETGKGTFKTIGEDRAIKERKMFGLVEEATPDEFPKYGFLSSKDEMNYENIIGWGYGDSFVKFKRSNVINRTSITLGDSYDGNAMFKDVTGDWVVTRSAPPVKMNKPTEEFLFSTGRIKSETALSKIKGASGIDELAKDATLGTYVEAQIYGKVTIADIESIAVTSVKKAGELEKALKKIGQSDIKIVPCKYDHRLKYLTAGHYSGPGVKYASSFTTKDIDNLGDFYIESLSKRYLTSAKGLLKNNRGLRMPDDLMETINKSINGEDISMEEKREWLKKLSNRMYQKASGGLPDSWYRDCLPSYGGWTDDVFNKELLKKGL